MIGKALEIIIEVIKGHKWDFGSKNRMEIFKLGGLRGFNLMRLSDQRKEK